MDEHVEAALMIAGAQMKAKDNEIARLRAELAAERERCAQIVREFPHWLGQQAKRELLAAMGFEA